MNQPIVFVGGIHGVGKTTLSRRLAALLGAEHVTASALIRAAAGTDMVPVGSGNKVVSDVATNQERLLRGLCAHRARVEMASDQGRGLLLDGHFCLLDPFGSVMEIPPSVFEAISPVAVLLVEANLDTVVSRLSERDGGAPSGETLATLANCERAHATAVCATLGIPLYNASGDVKPKDQTQLVVSQLRPHLSAETA